jgi:2-oxoglutarate ferredoxin oxidoreductase subunit gamma
MLQIAEAAGAAKSANLAGLAAAMKLCGAVSLEDLLAVAQRKGRPEVAEKNMEVLRRGAEAAQAAGRAQ